MEYCIPVTGKTDGRIQLTCKWESCVATVPSTDAVAMSCELLLMAIAPSALKCAVTCTSIDNQASYIRTSQQHMVALAHIISTARKVF